MVIAIDGPAGAGKSTVARALASELGYTYLDSGAMYRCVALAAIRDGAEVNDAGAVGELARRVEVELGNGRVTLDGEDVTAAIREPAIGTAASVVAAYPPVREAMVARQRELIAGGRFVAEGRDIGTVVSPDAPLKVYLTASEDERAARRAFETGEDQRAVAAAQAERDARDRGRAHSPLRPAEDAVVVDTTGLAVGEVVERVVALARERGLA